MTQADKYRIIEDPEWGFRRLDPIPGRDELAQFYQNSYYDLVRQGTRGLNFCNLLAGGARASEELAWMCSTLYADHLQILERERKGNPRRLLDLGCGLGDFLSFMKDQGWEVVGLEPSREASAGCVAKGLEVYNLGIEEFLAQYPQSRSSFSVVSLLNILEHVPNPVELLTEVQKLLVDGGMVLIQVPNDFSEMQESARQAIQKKPWWIAIPDHINYFNFDSLQALLRRLGFQVCDARGDFPMELFLLMGEDYIGKPEVGSQCHAKRRRFELSIPADLRRRMYQALAGAGVGRTCIVAGRREAS